MKLVKNYSSIYKLSEVAYRNMLKDCAERGFASPQDHGALIGEIAVDVTEMDANEAEFKLALMQKKD